MADLVTTLPNRIEIGATRRFDWATSIVETDDGREVRNNRWSASLRSYEVAFPVTTDDDADYLALVALYEEAEGQLYSFDFTDFSDGSTVTVRFSSELEEVSPAGHLRKVVFTLKEVR